MCDGSIDGDYEIKRRNCSSRISEVVQFGAEVGHGCYVRQQRRIQILLQTEEARTSDFKQRPQKIRWTLAHPVILTLGVASPDDADL